MFAHVSVSVSRTVCSLESEASATDSISVSCLSLYVSAQAFLLTFRLVFENVAHIIVLVCIKTVLV